VLQLDQRSGAGAAESAPRAPRLVRPSWPVLLLVAALVVGAALRFYGLNWDAGAHLHPDERQITMVAGQLHWPAAGEAVDPAQRNGHGPLDPYFFAYGSLPLYLLAAAGNVAHRLGAALSGISVALAALPLVKILVAADGYDSMNLVGRFLSGAFDLGTILLCFVLARAIYGALAGALAAALYAVAALAVQQAHFYVVDPVVTFLVLLTLLFSVRALHGGRWDGLLSGVCFGLALATKVSAAPLGLAVLLAQLLPLWQARRELNLDIRRRLYAARLDSLLLAGVGAALAFVATEPYALLDWKQFSHDVSEQSAMVRGALDYPYTRQYAPTRPYLYWLQGLLTWQLTPPLALVGLAGLVWQGVRALRPNNSAEKLLVSWWLPYLLLTGAFYAKFPRYLLPSVPLLCIAGAGVLAALAVSLRPRVRMLGIGLATLTLLAAGLYCVAYDRIYSVTNNRVAASDWIYQQIPPVTNGHQTALTHEVWDDALPLDRSNANPPWNPGRYSYIDLPIYDADTVDKQRNLSSDLQRADYVVEASGIVRGSILRNPRRYPMTVAYYQALADGKLGFNPLASFRNVPELFGLRLDDSGADLNWQFYDHPPVTIYRKVRQLSNAELAALLPLPAPPTTTNAQEVPVPLQLTPTAEAADNQSPTLAQMFPPDSIGMRLPVLVWLAVVEAMGFLALPWAVRLFRSLPDTGYAASKALGFLLTGWGTWLLASTGIARNTRETTLVVLVVMAVAAAIGWIWEPQPRALIRRKWRLWLAAEAVFLLAFGAFLLIRAYNPDLWHLYRGGEKPMELSYMHAMLRSQTLPPYDPWLSGTTINYYYFGLYLFSMLFKLTQIAPETGFNLAIPLVYALAMQLAASTGYALTMLLLGKVRAEARDGTSSVGVGPRASPVLGTFWADRLANVGAGWWGKRPPLPPNADSVGHRRDSAGAVTRAYSDTPLPPPAASGRGVLLYALISPSARHPRMANSLNSGGRASTMRPDGNTAAPGATVRVVATASAWLLQRVLSPQNWGAGGAASPTSRPGHATSRDSRTSRRGATVRAGTPGPFRGHSQRDTCSEPLNRMAVAGGLCAALLFGVLGNVDSGPYVLGLLQQSGAQVVHTGTPVLAGVAQVLVGLGEAVVSGGNSLPAFNYFDRSRVIPFTINEFPMFSFLYADLHPHVIDMPFELLAAALAVALIAGGRRLAAVPMGITHVLLGGLIVGTLWPTNVWDFPTFLLLAVAAVWLRRYDGRSALRPVLPAAAYGAAIIVVGRLAFRPFYQHFFALETAIGLPAHHSDLGHFVLVYGLFLLIAGTLLAVEQSLSLERFALLCLPALVVGFLTTSATVGVLAGLVVLLLRAVWLRRFTSGILATFLLLGLALCIVLGTELIYIKDPLQGGDWQRMNTVFKFGVQAWILLSLAGGPGLVWLVGRRKLPFHRLMTGATASPAVPASDAEAFAAGFEARRSAGVPPAPAGPRQAPSSEDAGLAMSDDRGGRDARAPYVAVSSLAPSQAAPLTDRAFSAPVDSHDASLADTLANGRIRPPEAIPANRDGQPVLNDALARSDAAGRLLPRWWWAILAVLTLCAALYPLLAIPVKERDRFAQSPSTPSLDGMAYMQPATVTAANINNQDVPVPTAADYLAIRWLQQHVAGIPVLLEANKNIYAWYGRVSWYTGLPTLLGWDYHTSQFHGDTIVQERKQIIDTLYTTPDPAQALSLLRQYHIQLIYVGPLERATYGAAATAVTPGLTKFDQMVGTSLDRIYDAAGVKIYLVRGNT